MLHLVGVCARRFAAGALAVALLAAVAPVAAAGGGAGPVKGAHYTGTQENGAGVSFFVSGNGTRVKQFASVLLPACSTLPVKFTVHRMTIHGNHFSGSVHPINKSSTASVTGHFQKGKKASGLVSWSSRDFIYCDSSRPYTARVTG